MKASVEVRCIICRRVFCCQDCRRRHEKSEHKLTYECPICREAKFVCSADNLKNVDLLKHIKAEHFPLHCNKCGDMFESLDDLLTVSKCSEGVDQLSENGVTEDKEKEKCLKSILEESKADITDNDSDIEAIISFNPSSRVATVTPIVKSRSKIFDEPSSSTDKRGRVLLTPFPKHLAKRHIPKIRRSPTPHIRKFLVRQSAKDFSDSKIDFDETDENKENERSAISGVDKLGTCDSDSASQIEYNLIDLKTPTANLIKDSRCLASAVTTSTPTNPSVSDHHWTAFPGTNPDSPLSEIEGTTGDTVSPGQSIDQDSPKVISNEVTSTSKPKLKSIIVSSTRSRIESQDSNENRTDCDSPEGYVESSSNIKKSVKFADDTKFENGTSVARAVLKPRRMPTPGPQRTTRHMTNPRFQAILKQFERETGYSIVHTPNAKRPEPIEDETPEGDPTSNNPARAINFKLNNDSPTLSNIDTENHKDLIEKPIKTDETKYQHNQVDIYTSNCSGNELFKSCIPESQPMTPNLNNAITAFSANIAGSIQSYLTTAVNNCEETTEIDFKFTITKRKVTVTKLSERPSKETKEPEVEREERLKERGGIWSAITKAIKSVLWRSDEEKTESDEVLQTPLERPSRDLDTSSGSKRKSNEMTEPVGSPLNHKKYKYESIKARRPLHPNFNGAWSLPPMTCDLYIAMDVTCSTSSIFNLVAISVDRYIAVTQPIKYAKHKNKTRVWLTIILVWAISGAIGLPIVLGQNDTPDRLPDQCLFYNGDYIMYSALMSFFIPCFMMIFLYYSIFKALHNRLLKQRAARKPPSSGETITGTTAVIIEQVAQTKKLVESANDQPTNTASGSNEEDQEESFDRKSMELEPEECNIISNNKSTEFILATVVEEKGRVTTQLSSGLLQDPNGNNDSGYGASQLEDHRETSSLPPSPLVKQHEATVLQNPGCRDGVRKNGSTRTEELLRLDSGGSTVTITTKKERKASTATRFTIYKVNKASKKKREKSSAKKERKATKTLAIVLGVFLICWVPFFTCNVWDAICGKLGRDCSPGVTVFIVTTWLGYMNSFVNPVIYTIFNPEFRKAFKKIMHFGT